MNYFLVKDENNNITKIIQFTKNEKSEINNNLLHFSVIKENFYEYKKVFDTKENFIEITRGQFFYLEELYKNYKKTEIKERYQLTSAKNVIFYGPPGTGKTYSFAQRSLEILYRAEKISKEAENQNNDKNEYIWQKYKDNLKQDSKKFQRITFVTFHPEYSYEAFIEGIKPKISDNNGKKDVYYEIENGAFLTACENAIKSGLNQEQLNELKDNNVFEYFLSLKKYEQKDVFTKAGNFVFIIDEINRGNIPRIFGELITLIEPDKRLGEETQLTVTLPTSKKIFGIPKNLHILASMNTSDRSIALMDTALRRRFEFVEIMPDSSLLAGIIIEGINVKKMFESINKNIEKYFDREHQIGHAYFIKLKDLEKEKQFEELCNIFENNIIPLLAEYFFEDWGKIKEILNNSDIIILKEEYKNLQGYSKNIYEINSEFKSRNYDKIKNMLSSIC